LNPHRPTVVALHNGEAFLVWDHDVSDVYGMILESDGQVLVPEFGLTVAQGNQINVSLTGLSNGDVVACWESDDGSNRGVFAKIFGPDGSEKLAEFRVNSYTVGYQVFGRAVEFPDDKLFFVWASVGQDTSATGIYGRGINMSTGAEVLAELRLNDYTAGAQTRPQLVQLQDGNVFVSWSGEGADADYALYGKIINPVDGSTVMSESRLNQSDGEHLRISDISSLNDGSVFILYQNKAQDTGDWRLYGRVLNSLVCNTTTVTHRYNSISWLKGAQPQVDATRESDFSRVVFSIPDLNSCVAQSVSINVAHQTSSGYQTLSSISTKEDTFQVTLDFNDSHLLDSDICNASDSTSTVVYDCTLHFQSYFYNDDFIVNWKYSLTLALVDNAVVSLAATTDQQNLAGDNVDLTLTQALVGGFDGSTRSVDDPFFVGDDAFMSISPPEDLVGQVSPTVVSVVVSDNEENPAKTFHLTPLSESQIQEGVLIMRVPLIIVSTQVEITVQVEWALGNERRLVEGDDNSSNRLVNYSTTLSVKMNSPDTTASEDESEGDSSSSDSDMVFIVLVSVISAVILTTAGVLGYRYISKKDKHGQTAIPKALSTVDDMTKV